MSFCDVLLVLCNPILLDLTNLEFVLAVLDEGDNVGCFSDTNDGVGVIDEVEAVVDDDDDGLASSCDDDSCCVDEGNTIGFSGISELSSGVLSVLLLVILSIYIYVSLY